MGDFKKRGRDGCSRFDTHKLLLCTPTGEIGKRRPFLSSQFGAHDDADVPRRWNRGYGQFDGPVLVDRTFGDEVAGVRERVSNGLGRLLASREFVESYGYLY